MRNNKLIQLIKSIKWTEISPSVYVRYILMLIAIVNVILTRTGLNPISVSEDVLYQTVSDILTLVVLIMNTWKDNPVTPEAIAANRYMKDLKSKSDNT